MTGDNPYAGILALSDRLIVTSDSVSMVSEALATGHPVETFDLEGRAPRHEMFIEHMLSRGIVRRFTGDPVPGPAYPPRDATRDAGDVVRRMLAERVPGNG
jgi:mitochondrial fission protein ELM1